MSKFVRLLWKLATKFECAVLLVTHTSKADYAGNFASGNSAWVNACRSATKLTKTDGGRIIFLHHKSNDAMPMGQIELDIREGVPHLRSAGATPSPEISQKEIREAILSEVA